MNRKESRPRGAVGALGGRRAAFIAESYCCVRGLEVVVRRCPDDDWRKDGNSTWWNRWVDDRVCEVAAFPAGANP